jgi:hypothetical protein
MQFQYEYACKYFLKECTVGKIPKLNQDIVETEAKSKLRTKTYMTA